MNDMPLPDDLAELAREAEKLVAEAKDADARQLAAMTAVRNAVQSIVDAAQGSIIKLYGYLEPNKPPPLLAVMWPVPAPTPEPLPAPATPVEPAPVNEAPAPAAPAADPVPVPVDFPVVAEEPAAPPPPPPAEPVAEAPIVQLELPLEPAPVAEVTAEPAPIVEPPVEQPPAPPVEAAVPDGFPIDEMVAEPAPVVVTPVEPVGGEVAPQEPAFPVDTGNGVAPEQPAVVDAATGSEPVALVDPAPVVAEPDAEPAVDAGEPDPNKTGDIVHNG